MLKGSVVVALLLPAAAASAQLIDSGGRAWVAPDRRFALEVPQLWNIYVDEQQPGTIELRPVDSTGDATLFIRRMKIPPGASPKQLRLNAIEQRLRRLPSFRELARRDAKLGALSAAAVVGVYYHQGNAQFPRAVEEVFIVQGELAYVFHFECFEPLAPSFAADLDRVYKSFVLDPPPRLRAMDPPNPYEEPPLVDPSRVKY